MAEMINVKRNVPGQMRDGTILYADIYYPQGEGPFPAILMRLPYDKTHGQDYVYAHPSWFARHGYLVVVQDTRGRWQSEGEFYILKYEMADGYDTVEWVAGLPECNGKVGMYGFSYVGATQLLAAVMQPPHLTCICPAMTGSQYFDGWAYNGGAFSLAFNLSWAVELAIGEAHRRGLPDLERELWTAFMDLGNWFGYLPLNEIPLLKRENIAPYFFDWINHPSYDDYWKQWSIDLRYDQIKVPCLFTGGWYDAFRDGTLKNFNSVRQNHEVQVEKHNHKLIVGPWYHVPWARLVGQVDFGEEARNFMSEVHLQWFDYWLRNIEHSYLEEPPVKIFVMGENTWRHEADWPPRGVKYIDYYFHSQNGANSLNGDGRLDRIKPQDELPDIYVYDPHSPVPSRGGHSCCFANVAPIGPFDQREVELQSQVLVYTTELLREDVFISGPVSVTLWAASSAVDTDFTVKLVDVFPDGRAINLTEGIIRARYRNSLEKPSLLEPGEVYKFSFLAGNSCNIFKVGHRIRVEISSSNFPHWDRNTNTGNVPAMDRYTDMIVATQHVFHDSRYPSHVTLPIVPI
jgi:putative CocE/NonD family hydrolase